MRVHWISLNSCFKSFVTRWASSALPLAFSAVIGWSVPARAADNFNADFPPDTFPYEAYYGLHVLITGAYEQVWIIDDITQFHELAGDATNRLLIVAQYCASCGSDLSSLVSYADDMASRYPDIPAEEWGFINGLRYWALEMSSVAELCSNGVSFVATMANSPQLANVLSRAIYTADGDLSGFDGSGGCDCAQWLQSILSQLTTIEGYTSLLQNMILQWNQWLTLGVNGRGILPFLFHMTYGFEQFYRDDPFNSAIFLANDVGVAVSNAAFTVSSLQAWARITDIWDGTFDSAGDWYADGDNALAKRLADVWTRFLWFTEPDAPGDFDNPFILGWRDFMTLRNVHPTNTADNALWVRGDGDDGAISVSGTVDFDEDALRDLLQSLEFQVKNSLSQPSLHVTVDNTNDFAFADNPGRLYENVVNNSTTINNIASEVQGQQAEYEDPDWTLDDYGSLFDLRDDVANWDFVGKWAQMFDDVQIEPPGPCKLWDGYSPNSGNDSGTPGPWGGWSQIIDIQSLYWYPMESCGGLIRSIRGVFRALWTLVLLIVIAGLVRINWLLARCGVRILIAVVSAFGSPDPMGAIVEVFETVLQALSQLYTGLFGGRPAESD